MPRIIPFIAATYGPSRPKSVVSVTIPDRVIPDPLSAEGKRAKRAKVQKATTRGITGGIRNETPAEHVVS